MISTDPTPIYTQDDMDVAQAALREWEHQYAEIQQVLSLVLSAVGGELAIPIHHYDGDAPPVTVYRVQDPPQLILKFAT